MFISYHINRGVLGPLVHNTTYNMAATGKTQNELWNDFGSSANNTEWCFKINPPTRKDDETELYPLMLTLASDGSEGTDDAENKTQSAIVESFLGAGIINAISNELSSAGLS